MLRQIVCAAVVLVVPKVAYSEKLDGWWWPELPVPAGVLRTTPIETFGESRPGERAWDATSTHMMVQSAAGLAAAAVKRGDFDEMVWITSNNPNHSLAWQYLNKRVELEDRGELKPWDLVRHLKDAGIIKGYVLYDSSRRGRKPSGSANVATSVAGLLGGVIVDERLEQRAKESGLTMLLDARDKDTAWLWENYRDRFNRNAAMFQDPRKPHARDFAIAHNIVVVYGNGDIEQKVLAWLEPLSPILGWNGGDEGQNAKLFSQYGHFNTATDWAMNLPLLSAGARNAAPGVLPKPETVKLDESRPVVSFVMSDGDNLQWMVQNFFKDKDRRYWSNPANGDYPFTWTLCLAHMRQVTPDLLKYTIDTIPSATSAVEFGGGYYFPDRFGELRDEPHLLAQQARKTWANMQAVGSDVLCLTSMISTATRQCAPCRRMPTNCPACAGFSRCSMLLTVRRKGRFSGSIVMMGVPFPSQPAGLNCEPTSRSTRPAESISSPRRSITTRCRRNGSSSMHGRLSRCLPASTSEGLSETVRTTRSLVLKARLGRWPGSTRSCRSSRHSRCSIG
jgi:hypothetical protein